MEQGWRPCAESCNCSSAAPSTTPPTPREQPARRWQSRANSRWSDVKALAKQLLKIEQVITYGMATRVLPSPEVSLGWWRKGDLLEKRHFFQLEVAVRRDSPPCFHMVMCCQHEGGLKYLRDVLPSTSQLISFITFPCKS